MSKRASDGSRSFPHNRAHLGTSHYSVKGLEFVISSLPTISDVEALNPVTSLELDTSTSNERFVNKPTVSTVN